MNRVKTTDTSPAMTTRFYLNPADFGPDFASAATGSTSPAPTSVFAPPMFFAVEVRIARTSAGLSSLLRSSISATTPEMCAAATEGQVGRASWRERGENLV